MFKLIINIQILFLCISQIKCCKLCICLSHKAAQCTDLDCPLGTNLVETPLKVIDCTPDQEFYNDCYNCTCAKMGTFGLCSKKHSKKCNQKARLRRLREESSVVLPRRPIPDTWWAQFRSLMFRQIENFENMESK